MKKQTLVFFLKNLSRSWKDYRNTVDFPCKSRIPVDKTNVLPSLWDSWNTEYRLIFYQNPKISFEKKPNTEYRKTYDPPPLEIGQIPLKTFFKKSCHKLQGRIQGGIRKIRKIRKIHRKIPVSDPAVLKRIYLFKTLLIKIL